MIVFRCDAMRCGAVIPQTGVFLGAVESIPHEKPRCFTVYRWAKSNSDGSNASGFGRPRIAQLAGVPAER